MKFLVLSLFLMTGLFTQAHAVECEENNNGSWTVYNSDHAPIGAYTFASQSDCTAATNTANQAAQGIVCAVITADNGGGAGVYRISDGRNIGGGIFYALDDCNAVVANATNGYVCVPFSASQYAFFGISSGARASSNLYDDVVSCVADTRGTGIN